MSTLAETPAVPATEPVVDSIAGQWIVYGVLAVWTIVGIIIVIRRYGILRPAKIAGHDRLPPRAKLWPLWVGFIVAFAAWIVATIAIVMVLEVVKQLTGDVPATRTPSGTELAILAVGGPVMAFVLTILVMPFFQRGTLSWLGLGLNDALRGARWGVLAYLVILPCMFVVSIGVEQLYRAIQYQHPAEHDLLRVMRQGDPLIKWLSVLGAVVVAPVFEELLFRGLLQTALTEWITRLSRPRLAPLPQPLYASPVVPAGVPSAAGMPAGPPMVQGDAVPPSAQSASPGTANVFPPSVAPPQGLLPAALLPPFGELPPFAVDAAATVLPTEPSPRRHRAAWIAIIITAGLFAIVHPLWTAPIIFALAIMLGYVYERTGNLWTSITVHALFNATSTILVLLGLE